LPVHRAHIPPQPWPRCTYCRWPTTSWPPWESNAHGAVLTFAQSAEAANGGTVSLYMTMGRIRFSSPGAYESFKVLFAETRHHLMKLPGFIHLTWWEHPEDPNLFCEISIWASKEAVNEWHQNGFHQHAKMWAQNGAIMEALINNFTLDGNRILRMC